MMNHPDAAPDLRAGEVLGTVLSEEQQRALLSLIADSPGQPAEVWQRLSSLPAFQGPAERLRFAVQLGLLTRNNVPLIRRILQDPSLSSARDLVRLDAAAWASLVSGAMDGTDVPAGMNGRTTAERVRNYASGLANAVRAALPSQTVAHLLQADTSLVADDPARDGVIRFLANCPDFDLPKTRISRYLAQNAEGAFAGIDPGSRPGVTTQLKRIQRAFQLGSGAETTAALLRRGLDSAHKIASIPRRNFLDQHGEALGGAGPAAAVYERALSVNGRSLLLYAGLNDAKNGITPRAIGGSEHAASMAQLEAGLIKQVPDYAELFGAMDICQCEDCRSVLSPAAYLVDLLQFLAKPTPNSAQQTPLDVLLARRPDIANIELTCENTNTTMPYINLVNEVLEGYVVNNGQPVVFTTLSSSSTVGATSISTAVSITSGSIIKIGTGGAIEYATTGIPSGAGPYTIPVTGSGSAGGLVNVHYAGDPVSQAATANDTGGATAAELDANPQYTLDQAYVTLAAQPYPFSLPFNQPVTVARTYLRHLGSSRLEIIGTFQPSPSAASDNAAAAEYLGITREQFQVLTGQDFDTNVTIQVRAAAHPPPAAGTPLGSSTATGPSSSQLGKRRREGAGLPVPHRHRLQRPSAAASTRFINPGYPQGADGELFARIPLDYPALVSLVQPRFSTTDPAILNALATAGITMSALQAWCARYYPAIGTILVLDNPGGGCDLATTVLTHLGDTGTDPAISTINDPELDRLQLSSACGATSAGASPTSTAP